MSWFRRWMTLADCGREGTAWAREQGTEAHCTLSSCSTERSNSRLEHFPTPLGNHPTPKSPWQRDNHFSSKLMFSNWILLSIPGHTACWCPISLHFLTRLLELALASWAATHVGVLVSMLWSHRHIEQKSRFKFLPWLGFEPWHSSGHERYH